MKLHNFSPVYVLIALMLTMPLQVGAQARVFDCDGRTQLEKSELQKVAEQLQMNYGKTTSIRASFLQQSRIASLDMVELSSGRMWFTSPGLMKWVYEEPEKQVFLLKQDTMWLHQVEDSQVLIDRVDKVLLSELPVSFLLGLGDLNRDFLLQSGCEGLEGKVLHLEPRDEIVNKDGSMEKNPLQALALMVNESFIPVGARVRDISGNVTTVLLESIVRNDGLYESEYEFTIPSGVDVLDRRTPESVG